MAALLCAKDLCKTYVIDKRQNNVLKNVNLEVKEGEMVAIMGPSGSGKSTLLYAISGMDRATSGQAVSYTHLDVYKRQLYNVTEEEAEKMMADIDKRRMTNYRFYTDQKWGMAKNYTLSLNSSELGYDLCEKIIMDCKK